MLNVFTVLDDEVRTEFDESFTKLWGYLGADEVFHGLFGAGFGVYVDIKLLDAG